MSSSSTNVFQSRQWMYLRINEETGKVTNEFKLGLQDFLNFASNQETRINPGYLVCPCIKCRNGKSRTVHEVGKHLYRNGFTPNYFVWFSHGEDFIDPPSSSIRRVDDYGNEPWYSTSDYNQGYTDGGNKFVEMETDAYHASVNVEHEAEEQNVDASGFHEMLDAANKPIYKGCREGHSAMSLSARMMSIKTDYNMQEGCVDAWSQLVKEYLPEDNLAPESYYEVQKMVSGLGLPFEVIDVCINNCMIFWEGDADKEDCRFCKKARFQPTSGRTRVPYKRMWYLPITDRLQRLFQSESTAGAMRWHAEHTTNGEITHPSDAEAWKHFHSIYPDFALERRNVYLGLCTDGFNPFGKTRQNYSLWPVILTPYNLPPTLCMKQEFLFLSILVPGPEHPGRSLDVFLQPLIHELNELWYHGARTFDISLKENFTMRAVLMWTISDFPAYGMLSGWMTHGKLSRPHCQGSTDAFRLKNGQKPCWFDCHRRFLPRRHPYRKSKTLFRKDRVVKSSPPPVLDGECMLEQMNQFGVKETVACGGKGDTGGNSYGSLHHWHKKSIFWILPYWKYHLLRHNLDVMHIEKNFFDNIMNTLFNVKGKSKDNHKSRLDLPIECCRPELHIPEYGKVPVGAYLLTKEAKKKIFEWIENEVKFSDGYASNLANCVDQKGQKFTGMKSHDCHVFMERLLPFAFAEILPQNVHAAIAGIGAFFRDLCTRTLTTEGIQQLDDNIPILLCDLEKIFPPSFFDVMEHLAIHLRREAMLGGPVQYRWMYPFERSMFQFKRKVKNRSKVEGSIIAQSLNEEKSKFSSSYFPSQVQTKARKPKRYDDGGEKPKYPIDGVPDIFMQVGRLSRKKKNAWLSPEDQHHAHTYILKNCDAVLPYESLFVEELQAAYPYLSNDQVENLKDTDFSGWLKYYVEKVYPGAFPTWFEELVEGPQLQVTSSSTYFTRGYAFDTISHGKGKSTVNYGVSVKGDSSDFYGIIQEIIEVTYSGLVNMKCVLFRCEWYDPILGRGTRKNNLGVVDVNSTRRYEKYDPFILASQADQVSYIPYPRVKKKSDRWLTVIKINPRGRVEGVSEQNPPMQQSIIQEILPVVPIVEETVLVCLQDQDVENLWENSGEEDDDDLEECSSESE